MQKYMCGLLIAVALCQNARGMNDEDVMSTRSKLAFEVLQKKFNDMETVKEIEFLMEAVKNQKLMERFATKENGAKNKLYKVLGEFALHGIKKHDNGISSLFCDVDAQLLRLRLVNNQLALYCATHDVKLNVSTEALRIADDNKVQEAANRMYDGLAEYTEMLLEAYTDYKKE